MFCRVLQASVCLSLHYGLVREIKALIYSAVVVWLRLDALVKRVSLLVLGFTFLSTPVRLYGRLVTLHQRLLSGCC